jgi:hypothetical protein
LTAETTARLAAETIPDFAAGAPLFFLAAGSFAVAAAGRARGTFFAAADAIFGLATAVVFFAAGALAADTLAVTAFVATAFVAVFLAGAGFAFAVAVADAARAGLTAVARAGLAAAAELFAAEVFPVALPAMVFALDAFAVLEADPDADFFAVAMFVRLLHSFSVSRKRLMSYRDSVQALRLPEFACI